MTSRNIPADWLCPDSHLLVFSPGTSLDRSEPPLLPFRNWSKVFLLVVLAFTASFCASAQKPNIIYIMIDDLAYGDLSIYGQKNYKTPNMDALAASGVRFLNAYSGAPVCTPTRASFMTGRYPARSTIGLIEPWTFLPKDSLIGLKAEDRSIVVTLKEAGYETALIGKWHLGAAPECVPRKHGFDYFFGVNGGAADYISRKRLNGVVDLFENETRVVKEGYSTVLFGDYAVRFLQQKRTKPFFLSLQFTAPHWPWQKPGDAPLPDSMLAGPVKMSAGGSPATFAAMVTSLDDQIGRISRVLKETGLIDNTLIIFTSDNGGEKFSNMGPYARGKLTVWEGGVRVPAFVSWKGKIKPGGISDQRVITMDWSATILTAAGADPEFIKSLDGIDIQPLLTDLNKKIDRTFYWRLSQHTTQHAIIHGDWKYLNEKGEEYLFNLRADPYEKKNLTGENQAKLNELKGLYTIWTNSVLKPILVTPPPATTPTSTTTATPAAID